MIGLSIVPTTVLFITHKHYQDVKSVGGEVHFLKKIATLGNLFKMYDKLLITIIFFLWQNLPRNITITNKISFSVQSSKIWFTFSYLKSCYCLEEQGASKTKTNDCNWTRTHNQVVLKRTLNHVAKLAKWFSKTGYMIELSCEYLSVRCILDSLWNAYVTWKEHTVKQKRDFSMMGRLYYSSTVKIMFFEVLSKKENKL